MLYKECEECYYSKIYCNGDNCLSALLIKSFEYRNKEKEDLLNIYNHVLSANKTNLDEVVKDYVDYFYNIMIIYYNDNSPIKAKENLNMFHLYLLLKVPIVKKYREFGKNTSIMEGFYNPLLRLSEASLEIIMGLILTGVILTSF